MLMKKILATIVLLCSPLAHAQFFESEALKFDQKIANCENKWFGAEGRDGKVFLGYVYIDPGAGFTFEHYGYLDSSTGRLRAVKSELYDKARFIKRIGENFPASCLTEVQVASAGLPSSPDSMKFYRDDRPLGEHHASWASHYNHIGANDIALDHVAKAIEAGFASPALDFEHAFALNALGRFDEVVVFLTPVVSSRSRTSDLIAELAYAHLRKGEYQTAIALYTQAVDHTPRSTRRWEFANNISRAHAQLGDSKKRDKWEKRSIRYKKEAE